MNSFAIVVSRFNEEITEPLLEQTLLGFASKKVSDVKVLRVPGAFELPLVAQMLAESGDYDAIICLGAVIRGETSHYDYVCEQASRGIMDASLATNIPIIFGVLTTENTQQAVERIKNGFTYALNAIEMVELLCDLND